MRIYQVRDVPDTRVFYDNYTHTITIEWPSGKLSYGDPDNVLFKYKGDYVPGSMWNYMKNEPYR